ncbi:MAG: DNA methyltransferase, partial [Usitatibacteraceae bacterium]
MQEFITKWIGVKGGAERANYGQFVNDFCSALSLPVPGVADGGVLGDYQFEGPVAGGGAGGNTGAIDLYKRGCFILEAKQSKLPAAAKNQPELFDAPSTAPASPSGARYDKLMRDALAQAKRYAVNLPANHPWPPFLIVCDVGRAFELYFDWSGNGRGYGHFPDQHSYRFEIHRFADEQTRDLFAAIWTNPSSVDPRAKSAEVSRSIAKRLADVSKWLEGLQKQKTTEATDSERSLAIEETALFLMRIVFCMFAEDVDLLPKGSFTEFLKKAVDNEAAFEPELRQLWKVMGSEGGERYASAIGTDVRYFNGGLFASAQTYGLSNADRGELLEAAKADWTKVEPAIFGTLLEQALTASERAKLGAHYTPRPYVERLVQATIMDVLDAEWETAQAAPDPLAAATAFHDRLCRVRVLDPACGTGNFLYVAMENLMRLEGDVIETIRQLGGTVDPRVGPQQFLGLELNPRAAVIAELVLWIGWLRWRMKNDPDAAPTPVLKQFGNINFGGHAGYDAVLRHTPTGEVDAEHPTIPDWPEADFIVGNPPFIGKGSQMRAALGDDYVEALWAANPRVPKSADFVMQWWDRAANLLVDEKSPLIRFGLVTTNSITGSFNRRVIENYLKDSKVSLALAIPDHPWTKATRDAAAVRIAMTVAVRGQVEGLLTKIVSEAGLQDDQPVLEVQSEAGKINADLSTGAYVSATVPLQANHGLSCNGMMLAGQGFKVTAADAEKLIRDDGEAARMVVRAYMGGGELVQRRSNEFVIDFAGMNEQEARRACPSCYQHLMRSVKPDRDKSRDKAFREKWWLFGRTRPELRSANSELSRYVATTETAKHRIFQFLPTAVVPDHMVIAIGCGEAFHLGALSSRIHCEWTLKAGGWLGVGNDNRYNKSLVFDPFPFPDPTTEQRAAIADLAEELDATRKEALAEVPGLTMTEIYNWRDKLRKNELGNLLDRERAHAARAGIVDRIHHQLDAAVAAAYGWPADLPTADIVTRLVALNAERAEEDRQGKVRWLRPDYQ